MTNHRFDFPKVILTGAGSRKSIPSLLNELGVRRPLIVTDKGVLKFGLLDDITSGLREQKFEFAVFSDVQPDPTDANVKEGFAAFQSHEADGVLAVGGGSAIDCAKIIAIRGANTEELASYMGLGLIKNRGVPLVVLPTTASTGSEATRVAVITDSTRNVKMMMASPPLMPTAAVVDYELTLSMPGVLTAAGGVDTFTHGLEAYVSKKASPFTDVLALSCVQLVAAHLRTAWSTPENREAREGMSLSALQGGMAFSNSGLCLVHGMSRPLGALYHIPHGLSNAVLLPAVTRFSIPGATSKYAHVARLLGVATTEDNRLAAASLVKWIEELNGFLQIPRLSACCKTTPDAFESSLAKMASDALASGSPSNNPVVPTVEQIMTIYREAW